MSKLDPKVVIAREEEIRREKQEKLKSQEKRAMLKVTFCHVIFSEIMETFADNIVWPPATLRVSYVPKFSKKPQSDIFLDKKIDEEIFGPIFP